MPSWTCRLTAALITATTGVGLGTLAASPSLAGTPPAASGGHSAAHTSHPSSAHHGPGCPPRTSSQPFAAWHDRQHYFLLPGADFLSQGDGWTMTGGTQVVTAPASPTGSAAEIPSGGSLTTPAFCLSAGDPVLRTFALTLPTGHSGQGASLKVSLVYADGTSKSVGRVPALSSWRPTRKLSLAKGRALRGKRSVMVQYRFTAVNGAAWELDNVYLDPRMRG